MNPTPAPPSPEQGRPQEPHQQGLAPPASSQRRWWLGASALGLAAGAGAFWWQSRAPGAAALAPPATAAGGPAAVSSPEHLGEDFWALTLPQPSGTDLQLSHLRGRPLVINFWATWCPPCVREMPLLDAFYAQYRDKGLQMLGVAVDGPQPVRAFLARSPVGFPVALAGADGSGLARALGNTGGGLPYTVLADAKGAIVRRQMGELQAAQLAQWAQTL